MKYYAHFRRNDFVVALGYKGEHVKRWLVDHASLAGDLTVSLRDGRVRRHAAETEDWEISLVDAGQETATGGRIKRLARWLGADGAFMPTGYAATTGRVYLKRLGVRTELRAV
jgi:glucose-1-phosphate cytidylyltransferase